MLVLLACLMWALAAAVPGQADDGSGSGGLQVTTCSADSGQCDSTTTEVVPAPQPAPSKTTTTSHPAAQRTPAKAGTEEHQVSLATGTDTVSTPNGVVDRQVAVAVRARPVKAHPKPTGAGPVAAPGPRPTVTTNGGAAAATLQLFSTDQALARFAIPPFLMPIYVQAGRAYGIPWNVLAAINSIETGFGRNLNVSSAGAVGWMQFMPGTWRQWGVDATGDGYADPYNPVDAIYATARYLRASGGGTDLHRAVFAYNHAGWYVDEVLKTASVYGSLPANLVGETSTLAYGRFPVRGRVSYGDDFRAAQLAHQHAAGLEMRGAPGATAIATQDVTVTRVLLARTLAETFARSGRLPIATAAPVALPISDTNLLRLGGPAALARRAPATPAARRGPALPARYGTTSTPGVTVVVRDGAGDTYTYAGLGRLSGTVRPGVKLHGGDPVGTLDTTEPALRFAIHAAGGAAVDPRPLIDGYRLEEAVRLYHATSKSGPNPFVPTGGTQSLARGHYVFPIPAGVHWTSGRVDMGWDIETGTAGVGRPLLAIGNAQILHIQSMGAFGPTWITYRLLDGAAAGRTVFIGHSGPPLVKPGEIVRAGQPIIRIHGGSYGGPVGHLEIGWANPDGTNTLAAPHYSEGDVTPEGASFQSFLAQLPGTFVDATFPDGTGTLRPEKVSAAQELALSKRLDKVVNPQVRLKPSPAAIRVTRRPPADLAPSKALSVAPTAAGAHIVDVDVPAGALGDEAYAIGTVDGTAGGSSRHETVVLRHRNGSWGIVGPAHDVTGKVVNPKLVALAAAHGGRGYAVGPDGAVVVLRGSRTPLYLHTPTHAALAAVAVADDGRSGVAVGDHGRAVRLDGTHATVERVASGAQLSAVVTGAAGTFAAGTRGADHTAALYRRGNGWEPVATRFGLPDGDVVRLTSVAQRGGALWVAGGLRDLTAAGSPERPFAAKLEGTRWSTFCPPSPALATVVELGSRTTGSCDGSLPFDARTPGAIGAVAATDRGAVVATPSGLAIDRGDGFRPLQGVSETSGLALRPDGSGWAIGAAGRMAAVAPPQDTTSPAGAAVTALPTDAGDVGSFAGVAAGLAKQHWHDMPALGIALRDAAFAGDAIWAIDGQTGTLVRFDGTRWTVPGDGDLDRDVRTRVLERMGARALVPAGDSSAPWGLRALSFRGGSEGYAVGDHGAIARFDGDAWTSESAPGDANLVDVADASSGPVAVGAAGTLLERADGHWTARPEVRDLVGGQDFEAVTALGDGTVIAAAGGTVVTRAAGSRDWQPSELAPLGVPVAKLAGYRDAAGALHAVALTPDGVVLDGTAAGWSAVPAATATRAVDVAVGPASGTSIAGYRDGAPVVVELTAGALQSAAVDSARETGGAGSPTLSDRIYGRPSVAGGSR